jgi:hypothetical protein
MNKWVSGPNKCNGCPIEKEQWLEFKLSHCCESDEWEIVQKLDEMKRTICHLTRKEKIARHINKAEPSVRRGQKAADLVR